MIWKLYKKFTVKLAGVIKVISSTVELCKTEHCFEKALQDGYCTECAKYVLLKETIAVFRNNNELMTKFTKEFGRNDLGKINLPDQNKILKSSVKTKGQFIEDINLNTFIPEIEIDKKANLVNLKKSVEKKNINEVAKKLQAAQKIKG